MSVKYKGTFDKLKTYVTSTGINGGWNSDETGKNVFRSESGGVLNWWPSSGTVNFQGAPDARSVLEKALKNMLSPENGVSVPTCIKAIENDSEPLNTNLLPGNSLKGLDASELLLWRVNKALSEHGLFVMLRDDLLCVIPDSESCSVSCEADYMYDYH